MAKSKAQEIDAANAEFLFRLLLAISVPARQNGVESKSRNRPGAQAADARMSKSAIGRNAWDYAAAHLSEYTPPSMRMRNICMGPRRRNHEMAPLMSIAIRKIPGNVSASAPIPSPMAASTKNKDETP